MNKVNAIVHLLSKDNKYLHVRLKEIQKNKIIYREDYSYNPLMSGPKSIGFQFI